MTSSGSDLFPSLCTIDGDNQLIDNQSIDGGRLLLVPPANDQTLFVPMERSQVLGDTSYVVRRLTPIETERLQGFWDNHTDLTGCDPDAILERMPQYRDADEKGKRAIERKVRRWCEGSPDGARYKCAGNSMAVPVMRFLAERIQMVDEMASEGAPLS